MLFPYPFHPLRIYWKDIKGTYLGCNKKQANYWNEESPDAIVGKTDAELHFKYRLKSIKESDQRVIKDKAPIISEDVTRSGRGEERAVLTHKMPLVNTNGEICGIVGMVQDVTDQRQFLKEKVIRDQSHDLHSLHMGLTTLQLSLEALIKPTYAKASVYANLPTFKSFGKAGASSDKPVGKQPFKNQQDEI